MQYDIRSMAGKFIASIPYNRGALITWLRENNRHVVEQSATRVYVSEPMH